MAAPDTEAPLTSSKRPKLVIGIDFGTTFSGVCWGLEGDTDVEVITEWPGKGNSTSQKVPTVLSYHFSGTKWGYQVNNMKQAVRGVKLLLDSSKEVHFGPAIESEVIIMKMKKDPVAVSGEFLQKLVEHAKRILGRRGIGALMETMDVQYILTVPAVWSDKAKDLTMQAACRAGIPASNLTLLSEPEAAAVYTIRAIQPNSIAKGDTFIVCDAGGGTVDLITYRVTQTEPMRMEEVVPGTGEICGSVMLDERFEAFLSNKIGEEEYRNLPDSTKRVALQRWQTDIKTAYAGPEDNEFLDGGYMVPLPGVSDIPESVDQGMLHMSSEEVEEIFEPVVARIQALVSDQQEKAVRIQQGKAPKFILLVGGLGASEYLYKKMQERFKELEVMQPPNAWSAVVRGAVCRGFIGNNVQVRKARYHYGINISGPFDPKIHDMNDPNSYWCPLEERWKVTNIMRWYIHIGDSLSESKPISFPFYRCVPLYGSFVFEDALYFCTEVEAPTKRERSVVRHSLLTSDLSRIPKDLFPTSTNSKGEKYYQVWFKLILTPQSASLLLELEFNSMVYGTVRAQYY